MKTTLDLPDHLMQQVKQRALQQGRPIKELMADYIRQGLHGPAALPLTINSGVLEVDEEGLPLYRPDPQLKRHSIDLATALRLDQDALMQEDRQRAGLPACLTAMCGWPQPLPSIRPMASPVAWCAAPGRPEALDGCLSGRLGDPRRPSLDQPRPGFSPV